MTRRAAAYFVLFALVLTYGLTQTGATVSSAKQGTPAPGSAGVSREILGTGLPAAAPGQTLYLYRVTVAPGAGIATHRHPGTQVAAIVSGRLTYTVLEGEVDVSRAAVAGTPGPVERVTGGTETILNPGDSLVEHEATIHHARNAGDEPVVILLSSLITTGQPLSLPASAATPSA